MEAGSQELGMLEAGEEEEEEGGVAGEVGGREALGGVAECGGRPER